MRLQIDTVRKTVRLNGSYMISQLIAELKILFPKDWGEYKIEAHTSINIGNHNIGTCPIKTKLPVWHIPTSYQCVIL